MIYGEYEVNAVTIFGCRKIKSRRSNLKKKHISNTIYKRASIND